MDERRRRAAALFAGGASRAAVARALGVSRTTATHWYRAWKTRGHLRPRPRGRPPRLGPHELARVEQALMRPPHRWGFECWSLAAIAALIERLTGAQYHPRHVGRVLRRMAWVVPPVGRGGATAIRCRTLLDPDGNAVRLLERA